MPNYSVPVTIEIHGDIEVEANSPEEAIEKAKAAYSKRRDKLGTQFIAVVDCPCIEIDFASGDDPDEVVDLEAVHDEEVEDD